MKNSRILLLALTLAACAEPPPQPTVLANAAISRIPPRRVSECVVFALVDDRCTANWYQCRSASAEDKTCFRAWEECCTLPGQGARSRLGAPETATDD